jgi:hypothetical protein
MKHFITALLIVLFSFATTWAQRGKPMERIHAAKMAYITDRIHLSKQQFPAFMPVYGDYEQEIRDARQFFLKKYKGSDPAEANDPEALRFIDDNLDYQQKVIDIKRKYNDQFLKVISPQQLAQLNTAEREFKQMLIKRLEKQHGRGGRFNNLGSVIILY